MIRALIDLYIFILILNVILSYIPQARGHEVAIKIKRIADYSCSPIRKMLPQDSAFDFSTVLVIFGLNLLKFLW